MVSKSLGASQATGLSQAEPVSRLGPSGFDPSRVAWLHVRGQFTYHGEAYIVGTRAGLLALRAAIDGALENGEGEALASATDGESYGITVRRTTRLRDMGDPPYIDQLARDVADYEREWMRKTQRHNFDLYAKIKRENAIAMEARRGETPQSGSTAEGGDSAGRNGIAQNTAASDAPASAQSSTSIDARRAQERK